MLGSSAHFALTEQSSIPSTGVVMTARIPMSITHSEWLEAMKPLWELLGTSPNEIVGDFHIIAMPQPHGHEIRFTVVAQPQAEAADFPPAILAEGHPQDDEFGIWTHAVNVEVLG